MEIFTIFSVCCSYYVYANQALKLLLTVLFSIPLLSLPNECKRPVELTDRIYLTEHTLLTGSYLVLCFIFITLYMPVLENKSLDSNSSLCNSYAFLMHSSFLVCQQIWNKRVLRANNDGERPRAHPRLCCTLTKLYRVSFSVLSNLTPVFFS